MDGVAEEVLVVETESTHLQTKEIDYLANPESCNALGLPEGVIPAETDYPSSSHEVFAGILDGETLRRNGCGFSESVDCSKNKGGVIVEELTVRNYNKGMVLGSSNNREGVQTFQNQRQMLYQLEPGSGSGNSKGDVVCRGSGHAMSSRKNGEPHILPPNICAASEQLGYQQNRAVSSDTFLSAGARTKILSKSGFSEFFIKSTLRGKGLICRGPVRYGDGAEFGEGDGNPSTILMASAGSRDSNAKAGLLNLADVAQANDSSDDGVSLREWLKADDLKVNKLKSLYVFKQILNLVDFTHSQGMALQDIRPSCFKLFVSNQVKYVGKSSHIEFLDNVADQRLPGLHDCVTGKRLVGHNMHLSLNLCTKKQKFNDSGNFIRWQPSCSSRPGSNSRAGLQTFGRRVSWEDDPNKEYKSQEKFSSPHIVCRNQQQLIPVADELEEKWYTSPEDISRSSCSLPANIYQLGVLFFELLCNFNSEQAHVAAMSDLRHRILPPQFLSEYPREAGFCLWLLHPESSLRPTTREIMQSEVISGLHQVCGDEFSSMEKIEKDDNESELLFYFLLLLKEQKQKRASELVEDIRSVECDIEEVEKRRILQAPAGFSFLHRDHSSGMENKFVQKGPQNPEALHVSSSLSSTNDLRLVKNMSQLENAYFSMRSNILAPESEKTVNLDGDLQTRGRKQEKLVDPLGAFFDGLCKYARYSKFEVRSVLNHGEFVNSSNVICSLSFDRDEDYFAAAGISKKIKIFDFHALLSDSVDIHYPVVEMLNRSKLSCVCFNNYIKNYLASADYDGVVKLWDAGTGQAFCQFIEHQKRAWSVDFSRVDPTRLASGSDDHTVKLWSINEKTCLGTIRNKANVCCVQFSPHQPHMMAFGSADYRTYCYDLRNAKIPWCVLAGHEKTVSYVKFLDSTTVVSASTDNTLKLWDLTKINSSGLPTEPCYLTLSGHTNEKNFVGLSVDDGYIACGSETNEVYTYYKSMPMPITSYKFGSIDPISGKETDDGGGQFVSSVCWRRKSDMVVAANSTGCIKVLQMV